MKNIFDEIKSNPLFRGIEKENLEKILACTGGRIAVYGRDEIIILAGNPIGEVGLVLKGRVKIIREAADGRTHIIAEISPHELFGETFACAEISCSPVTALAACSCEILFLDYKKIVSSCEKSCVFHSVLIKNMLAIMAEKNLLLNRKLEILSKRTTRERLMVFFEMQADVSKKIVLPYGRDEMAAILCVDRSAMSAELSRMERDGLIRFHKNEFELM